MVHSIVIRFDANLWRLPGKYGRHRLNLPLQLSAVLKDQFSQRRADRGRVKVKVQIADQHWQTSLLCDDSVSVFMIAVKARVRTSLKLEAGALCQVQLTLCEQ